MKVWIDQDLCTGDGLCEEIAPDVFFGMDDGRPGRCVVEFWARDAPAARDAIAVFDDAPRRLVNGH